MKPNALLISAAMAAPLAMMHASVLSATAPTEQDLAASLDKIVDAALTEKRLVGAVVIVVEDGKVVYRRAAGLANRETGSAMRSDSIFRLTSVSKPYVTATAMRLVEQGKLRLDDPVTRWLPGFRPKMADGSTATITIRQLLNHTSGLGYGFGEGPDGPYTRLGVSTGTDEGKVSLDENLRRLSRAPLLQAPGAKWTYSLSTDVLGSVIEKVTKRPLPAAVEQLVLRPLQLRDTGFQVRAANRLTAAYADGTPQPVLMHDGQKVPLWGSTMTFRPSRALDPNAFPSGGAGMQGSAEDFVRFIEVIRKGGSPILRNATVAEMMRDQVGPQAQAQGPGWGFGFGWAVLDDPIAAKVPMSTGTIQWLGAYGHNWFVDPVRKLTVVIFTNTAFEGMSGRFPVDVRNAVYAAQSSPSVGR